MKTKILSSRIILPMVCSIPLMTTSCATNKPMDKPAWNIQPVYKVNNVAVDNPNAQYQVGRYFQGQRRYEQAAQAYKKAIAADDGFVEAHNGLGVVYSMQGKYDAAVTEFVIAIGLAPKASHLYNNLGHTFYLKGAYAEAVSALEQAASLDPGNSRTMKNLGMAYAKAGEAAKSQQAFADAAKPADKSPGEHTSVEQSPAKQSTSEQATVAAPITPAQAPVANAALAVQTEPGAGAGQAVVAQVTVPEPVKAPELKAEPQAPVAQTPIAQTKDPEVQTLALPKDRGVITPAPVAVAPVPKIETPVQIVEAAPAPEPGLPTPSLPAPVVSAPETQVAQISKMATVAVVQPVPVVAAAVPVAAMESRPTVIPPILMHLEVSNGNGTTGMARKVATYLRESGYAKARLTNQKPYTVRTTQIQYRSGHQADAEQLRASLPSPAAMVQSNNLRDDINLRVLLGRDLVQHTAYFDGHMQTLLIAAQ